MIVFVLYYIRGSLTILNCGGLHLVKWNHILCVILDEIRDLRFNPCLF